MNNKDKALVGVYAVFCLGILYMYKSGQRKSEERLDKTFKDIIDKASVRDRGEVE